MKEKRVIEINDYHGDMSLTLHTKYGDLRVDIEKAENSENDSANISFFPAGAEGDGFDIARVFPHENGDIEALTFTNVFEETATGGFIISKDDIDRAFYLGKYAEESTGNE